MESRFERYTDTMSQAAVAEFVPLDADSQGVLRVGGTNVTLDMVVEVYRAGNTAEEIVRHYPSLQLADVYAVLTYYLRHHTEVDTYIRRRQEKAASTVPLIPTSVGRIRPEPDPPPSFPGIDLVGVLADQRSELLARKYSGEKLSPVEQERLETLTARLKEALPPVSPRELEALLEMTKDVELIRERALERRQRLGLG
jgi:uncharacterized protein (DUF433 family)